MRLRCSSCSAPASAASVYTNKQVAREAGQYDALMKQTHKKASKNIAKLMRNGRAMAAAYKYREAVGYFEAAYVAGGGTNSLLHLAMRKFLQKLEIIKNATRSRSGREQPLIWPIKALRRCFTKAELLRCWEPLLKNARAGAPLLPFLKPALHCTNNPQPAPNIISCIKHTGFGCLIIPWTATAQTRACASTFLKN